MELTTVWFLLIAVLWTGFFVLEGFDFGVGALLPVLGRSEDEQSGEDRRRLMLTTIGPHWDGNEVWMITAVGAMFAAFPVWYATLFSGLYLPMLLVLLVLILRNVGLEYRHKRQDRAWTRGWDRAIVLGSFVAPIVLGSMLTALAQGLPITESGELNGGLGAVLAPQALLGGIALTALAMLHGAFFLALKTQGEIRLDAGRLARRIGPVAMVMVGAYALSLGWGDPAAAVLAAVGLGVLVLALVAHGRGTERLAFAGTAVTVAALLAAVFARIFPAAIPSSLDPAWTLSLTDAASSPYTLTVMTWIGAFLLPLTLIHTGYSYWVFRRRIDTSQLAAH